MKKISFIGIVFSLFVMVSFLSYTPVASAAIAAPTHTYLFEGTVTDYEEGGGGNDMVGLAGADRFTGTVTYSDSDLYEFLLTFYVNDNQITPDYVRWDYYPKGFTEVYESSNSVSLITDREDWTYVGENQMHWMELNFDFNGQAGGIILSGGMNDVDENGFQLPYYKLSGEITTMSPVPIPSAVWLLGTGLLGLTGFRKIRNA
ncbi:MAG: hypothetical protein WC836_15140 [Desulfobacula sp.]